MVMREVIISRAALVLAVALPALAIAVSVAHAGSILTQGQLNAELGTSCAAQGKTAPCITPVQMSDLVSSAIPGVTAFLAAAGTTQGAATALTNQITDVTTVAAGAGVSLPAAVVGQVYLVCDDGGNSLSVYPASGAAIGGLATNAPYAVTVGQCSKFTAVSATLWKAVANSPPALAAGFYVSPAGSDNNPGTVLSPFLTLGKCQTAMQLSANKVCYLRAGTYSMSAGLTLAYQDVGETWSYYPPDGLATAMLTQTSAFAFFTLNTGADQVTITGLAATGFQHVNHSGCGTGAYFISAGASAASGAGPNNLVVSRNVFNTFDCGVLIEEATNPIVSFNQASVIEYQALACHHCAGAPTQTIWQGNIVYDVDPDGVIPTNAYGIVFSNPGTGVTSNISVVSNQVYNSHTWECFDIHGGTNIYFLGNLCVGAGGNAAFNHRALSATSQITNVQHIGNIVDNGFNGNALSSVNAVVLCGSNGCGDDTNINGTSSQVANDVLLVGSGNGTQIYASPAPGVTVSGNTGSLNVEQVSSITFAGAATNATATHGQGGAVVATLAVNMSNTYWAFPTPPGTLSIGGTNSGGFVLCNLTQICQPPGGAAAGTYNDFSITATLHGMFNSPFTATAGSLTITAQ
jgi:hypothetical protein